MSKPEKWEISKELSDETHIVIDTGRDGCIKVERHIKGYDADDEKIARLLAAAPDGLAAAEEARAALYGCREALGSVANIQHAIDLLEAFIAKAEGRSDG